MNMKEAGFAEHYVCYTRVSTGGQEDNTSPESQLEACKRYGDYKGWEFLEGGWFHDTISGTKKGADRKMLGKLYELIESKEVKHVVFKRVDRVGREASIIKEIILTIFGYGGLVSIADKGRTYKNFRECNADIRFEGMIAEIERDNIVEKNWEGRINQFKKGSALGKQPYGYTTIQDSDKGRKFRRISIVNSEADALVDFLEKFVETRNIKEALDYAREKGYKVKSGAAFTHHFLRDTLKNIGLYTGKPQHQVYTFFEEKHEREFTYPAIISPDLYLRVMEAKQLKTKASRDNFQGVRPYLGIVYCSYCGAKAGVRLKTKSAPKKNGETYSSFIIFCPNHAKTVQRTYRIEGKGNATECGKSFRYTEITKKLLEFLSQASELGTAEGYSRELSRVLGQLIHYDSAAKGLITFRDTAAKSKDNLVKKLNKLMEMDGVDITPFIEANADRLKELDTTIKGYNLEIADYRAKFDSLAGILEASGLEITPELLASVKPALEELAADVFSSKVKANSPRELSTKIRDEVVEIVLPEVVRNLAEELSQGLTNLEALITAEEWEAVNTLLYRLGVRVYVDFNEPLGSGKLPEMTVGVALSDPENVDFQNTTVTRPSNGFPNFFGNVRYFQLLMASRFGYTPPEGASDLDQFCPIRVG